MTKAIKYFFQSVIVYLLFLIGRILGLAISRKLFAALFVFFGPILRSNKIAEKNLKIIDHKISNDEIKKEKPPQTIEDWRMSFSEYEVVI